MILSGQEILKRAPVSPCLPRTAHHESGMTFGAGPAGYDVRVKQAIDLPPGEFMLASTVEYFDVPADVLATVHDKSTLARLGLSLFNTVVEPGWKGFLTLELVNHSPKNYFRITPGSPIAQVIFHLVQGEVEPYSGRYQDQADEPTTAKFLKG